MLCLFVAIALLLSNGFMLSPAFAQDTAIQSFNPQELLRSALKWVASLGYIGGLVFIFIYIVSTVAFIPGSILTLGAGVLFGVVLGSLYVFVGATLGAIAAFLVGRYLARDWIGRRLKATKNLPRLIDPLPMRDSKSCS
jgi:uncharacterized membrane protein YdjX (TVP38/TMEM64 family)